MTLSLKQKIGLIGLGVSLAAIPIVGHRTDQTIIIAGTYKGYSLDKEAGSRMIKIDGKFYEASNKLNADTLELNREYKFRIERPIYRWAFPDRVTAIQEFNEKKK